MMLIVGPGASRIACRWSRTGRPAGLESRDRSRHWVPGGPDLGWTALRGSAGPATAVQSALTVDGGIPDDACEVGAGGDARHPPKSPALAMARAFVIPAQARRIAPARAAQTDER